MSFEFFFIIFGVITTNKFVEFHISTPNYLFYKISQLINRYEYFMTLFFLENLIMMHYKLLFKEV
jgi:hypothetical protein